MAKNEDKKPKVFISYSWSPPAHKDWVRGLAHNLADNGVEVVLDQWEVKPGNDLHPLAESMVLDETIDKVIMVCNASYAQKADNRSQGVGVETQIISEAIYKKTKQDKFIPVVSEVDDEGEPYLPVYCKSRFFIDMSNEDRYSDGLEELLRTIYNEPLHPKPEVGSKPNFSSNAVVKTSISTIAQRACISLRERNKNAIDVTEDCLSACVEIMEQLSIKEGNPRKEVVISHVNEFLPIRNDMVKVFLSMARYLPERDGVEPLHRFFEKMLNYYDPGRDVSDSFMQHRADHFKFLAHEMFLYAIAAFIKREKFGTAAALMDNEYYVSNPSRSQAMLTFPKIMVPLNIEHWDVDQNELPNLENKVSRANALIKRATIRDLPLIDIQQADLVLAIKSMHTFSNLLQINDIWALTVAPHTKGHHVFEVFARAQSQAYFYKMKDLLGVSHSYQIPQVTKDIYAFTQHIEWDYPDASFAIGIDKICTKL